ncbi:AMP-binding protein [Telmatobacter bradus]|uniref:AMP-binding protein n=1 Tax=Telmatobacter bradus TaxID=474953 RepID=UPI003B429557
MVLLVFTMREHLATLVADFRRHGRQRALVHHRGTRRIITTYAELAQLAGRFATLLESRGIQSGERVLLWGENSAEWIAAFYGCMLRGVLAVPLDVTGSADFARRVAADVEPQLVVGDEALLRQLPEEYARLRFEDWPGILPAGETGPVRGLGKDTPLQILFTSGTTGDPKGVVLTHDNILASIAPIEEGAKPYLRYERLIHPLRILHTLPLSHVFGQTMGLWVPPIFAAELHMENHLVAARLIKTIRNERISVLAAVPRVHALLKAHLEAEHPGLSEELAHTDGLKAWQRWWRFRKIHRELGLKFWALISGGGALSGPIEQFWNSLGLVLVQGYGMTESSALITLNHPFHVAKGTIGKPMPGREVKLGEDGEVLVRGATIAPATWQNGSLLPRSGEWLATGDLATQDAGGALRFVGRKSEVIVTAAGLNIHPEDLEAAVEAQAGVHACAVVAADSALGPEPFAVLACRGEGDLAAHAIAAANAQLAEFQRIHRWALWPEPDLPRTSTGKVRRQAVRDWLQQIEGETRNQAVGFGASSDWLLVLIEQISGKRASGVGDELRLSEDLGLDSLGRIQLAAALEERLALTTCDGLLDGVETLGQLRDLVEAGSIGPAADAPQGQSEAAASTAPDPAPCLVYPRWPWSAPFCCLRLLFQECVARPLVALLAAPRVTVADQNALRSGTPLLIIANHGTAYDGALILYALPAALRRRVAIAMAGEMLVDYRRFRNPEDKTAREKFFFFGPLVWLLLTALYNVFPLPRRRNFQASFRHIGSALDAKQSVLLFPEGTRSASGELADFRPGIGLLARQTGVPVLPVALKGLDELKTSGKWFRSGHIEVRIGQPLRFTSADSESFITTRLQQAVEELLIP